MLTRIIVAVIAIPILILVIFLAPLWALGFVVGVIAALSAWEFLRCTEKNSFPGDPGHFLLPSFFTDI